LMTFPVNANWTTLTVVGLATKVHCALEFVPGIWHSYRARFVRFCNEK
jgi:hypothetical protein